MIIFFISKFFINFLINIKNYKFNKIFYKFLNLLKLLLLILLKL